MSRDLSINAADPDDEALIRKLQAEAVGWLPSTGTNQWQPEAMKARNKHRDGSRGLGPAIHRGEVYLVRQGDAVVGTLTLDEYADPEFWTPEDDPDAALYVHRMIVTRRAAGNDLGGYMLDWAEDKARVAGKRWLRLDAWRTNRALCDYYRRHDFQHVRTVDLPHRGSGALYQREVIS